MKIGVPTEVKEGEGRVAITAAGVHALVGRGHEVIIEAGAGVDSSITDEDYAAQGATIGSAQDAWDADLVVKVKEPVAEEYQYLREDLTLFCYLHLAAEPELTHALLESRATAVAYETVQPDGGGLPLLQPMSEVAGRLATQVGAYTLMRPQGGRGVLMGGIGGVEPARVVVLGGGVSGRNAADVAVGLGAEVTVLDTDLDKLRELLRRYGSQIRTLASTPLQVEQAVTAADLVIGAVLTPGGKAPTLVSHELVATMRPGSVVVDIAVDQGGCFEDSRPTTHADPTFMVEGTVFYCVGNMPGAVPTTSTGALANATLPPLLALADHGWREAMEQDSGLARGLNVHAGAVTNEAVAKAHGLTAKPIF
ncbi:alanine dehydrogenase [Parenemella sanctibonifatiensis]|uniref:Alanine dehydrogenase n=1 Tax=Parenemella sanctibonifatiensis TaxID=2016505 RepID=A0A255ELJ4_9ACTN|nr:alanine dehydrogenase [Parenemella sanctibonifatiensis]OYN89013.1 alanine dehydrogenase [Parenemella sanctibonifatiensis]